MTDLPDLVRRCADGELTDGERAGLLAALRADPGGFEPLALALLERQTLAAALRAAADDATPVPAPAPVRPRRARRAAGLLASAAAGLLVGLGVNRPDVSPAPVVPIAAAPVPVPADDPPEPDPAEPARFAPPAPVAALRWRGADGAPVTLPVYEAGSAPPIDPLRAETEELIRTGRFAGSVRQEYTVPLPDGRLLTVPVHAVGVRVPEVF